MLAHERHQIILNLLKTKGSVTTSELIEQLNVSVETIRRDLLVLEQKNQLQRVHGGAMIAGEMPRYRDLSSRKNDNNIRKQELCYTAVRFIQEKDVIGVGSGSTAIWFAEALKEKFTSLTVVTNSLDVFETLIRYKEFKVILCGGEFSPDENCFVGPLTINMFNQLHVQKSFVFPMTISLKHGICNHLPDLHLVQAALIKASDKVYILGDSSKFERGDLLKQEEMLSSYTYITDRELIPGLKKMYQEQGLRVITSIEDL